MNRIIVALAVLCLGCATSGTIPGGEYTVDISVDYESPAKVLADGKGHIEYDIRAGVGRFVCKIPFAGKVPGLGC